MKRSEIFRPFLCVVMSRIMGLMKNENGKFCHLNLNESFFGQERA